MAFERGSIVVGGGGSGRGKAGGGGVVNEGFDRGEDRELEHFANLEGVGVGEGYCAGFGGRWFGAGGGGRGEGDDVGGSGFGVKGGGFVGGFFED